MSIYASVASVLPDLRAQADSLMQDTFEAFRPNGTDVVGGLEVQHYDSMATTLGKVQGTSAIGKDGVTRSEVIGGVERPVIDGGLHLPLSSAIPASGDVGVGWEYQCAAVGPLSDPSLLGRRYIVVNVPAKSFATARRLDVVELPQEA